MKDLVKLKVGDMVRIKDSSIYCEGLQVFWTPPQVPGFLGQMSCRRSGFSVCWSDRLSSEAVGRVGRVIGVREFEDGMQFVVVLFWNDEACLPVVGFSFHTGKEFELVGREEGSCADIR